MTNFIQELKAKMAASSGVVSISEEDELRLETQCHQAAVESGYNCFRWTYTDGLVPVSRGITADLKTRGVDVDQQLAKWATMVDPAALLREAKNWGEGPSVILAFDLFTMANRLPTLPIVMRLIKDITELQQQVPQVQDANRPDAGICQLVLCDRETPQLETPLQRMRLELPDRKELTSILDGILQSVKDESIVEAARDNQDRILNALAGLPAYQVANAISESLVRVGSVDASLLKEYKKELVSAKGLTWIDTAGFSFDDVGGLEPIKKWADKRVVGFDKDMQKKYGTRPPKGMLVGGKPGCSKSHFAKCLANRWGMVLLRFDVSAVRDKFVGGTSAQLEAALLAAEAMAPCVLHVDEIDKQFQQVSGESDGGVGSRTLGTFLTWMAEKTTDVFVYGAGNQMAKMPSEFMRAGRFDASFWFDLPTEAERASIVDVFTKKYLKTGAIDKAAVVQASARCSGAELESSWEEASLTAMSEDRDIITEDLVAELKRVTKVEDTFIINDELAAWRDAAQRANDPEEASATSTPTQKVRRIGRVRGK